MHVKAKSMAVCGLMLALSVVFMVLGSVIETSTLFLLAAASYFTGIVIREFGPLMGSAFWLAAVLLGFLLAPNKFYVITFAAMGFYIVAVETAHRKLGASRLQNRRAAFWIIKYIIFNILYIPGVLLFQELLFGRGITGMLLVGIIAAGQIGIFIYDRAYEYVQRHIWSRMRGHLMH
ncbi:hypothetical protein [Dorea sp. D27]|uniref:hypothetical protein n=1 Tax=Dorea sp. D27 TaxID=658665 RepID=UPI0006739DB0|nr:hypothetical protein [Dorea sp. D27]KMZ54823.1 hypothetical protein HMPREF0980_01235 [Dorea sp. D27]